MTIWIREQLLGLALAGIATLAPAAVRASVLTATER
jgi:hypothetical protein